MKIAKHLLCLLLCLVTCAALVVPAAAAYPETWDEAKAKMKLTCSMDEYDSYVDHAYTLYKEDYDYDGDYDRWEDTPLIEEEYNTRKGYTIVSGSDTITVKNAGTDNDYYLSIYVTSFIKESNGKYVSHYQSQQGYSLRSNGKFEHVVVSAMEEMGEWSLKKLYAGESVTISASDLCTTIAKSDYQADGEYVYELELFQYYPAEDKYWSGTWYIMINDAKAAEFKAAGEVEEDPGNPFTDVPKDSYYHDAVVWALENNVTKGMSATTFGPKETCTRGQVATFLWRALGSPEPQTTENPFKDIKESDYYYKPILWAYENGITNGTSKTEFSPNGTCTSAHVVTFLWRANGKPAAQAEGTEYYAEAVAWANSKGLLDGVGATFKPENNSPRADIVTYLYRNAGGK